MAPCGEAAGTDEKINEALTRLKQRRATDINVLYIPSRVLARLGDQPDMLCADLPRTILIRKGRKMDDLTWVDEIKITSIVDNFVDLLLQNEGPAQRRPRQEKAFERCLCAEHGLAEVVQSARETERFALLFDFGATPLVYLNNLQLLIEDYGFDLAQVRTLVLSHGHWDHYGGLSGFIEAKRPELAQEARL